MQMRSRYAARGLLILVVVSLTGCGEASLATVVPVSSHAPYSGPPACSQSAVRDAVLRFFDAQNRGDEAQLAAFLGPGFMWYSILETRSIFDERAFRHFTAYSKNDALSLFRQRHQHGERLTLRSLDVSYYEAGRDLVHVGFTLTREADDLAPGLGGGDNRASGKGALQCRDLTLVTWSSVMSIEPPPP